ncbi:MAG TPA: DUF2911 domain-containing protein [Gemmatimonadaceae bacterium]|nr:DUF2911 domain-containing protein [Gemmatimonadaceae bacterium]
MTHTTQVAMRKALLLFTGALVAATPLAAQQATFYYRLGKDTIAVEQFTRTATSFTGEVIRRVPNVLRIQYDITLGAGGKPTRAVIRQRQADGTPLAGQPSEARFTFGTDSVKRENVFPDSTQTRMLAAKQAAFVITWPSVATAELLYAIRKATRTDSFTAVSTGGVAMFGLTPTVGDTMRLIGGPYPMRLRFDADGRMLSVDGFYTTNKITGVRAPGGVDMNALAAKMTPMGVASARGTVSAGFGGTQSPVVIDYGRPKVRERSVWGGELVPFDTVWRAGANAATHLATSKPLAFGDVVVPPGMYTLWIQHTRNGTSLIINKAVGVWGTQYDSTQVLGRAPLVLAATPEFVEEFTISIRVLPQNRGAIDFAWGSQVATATFTVRQ